MQFTDTASAGNGGVATSSANGGAVGIGDVNSGGNAGNAIGIGDTWGGPVSADGGTVDEPDRPGYHGQRRHRHLGCLWRRLQPRLRQLAPSASVCLEPARGSCTRPAWTRLLCRVYVVCATEGLLWHRMCRDSGALSGVASPTRSCRSCTRRRAGTLRLTDDYSRRFDRQQYVMKWLAPGDPSRPAPPAVFQHVHPRGAQHIAFGRWLLSRRGVVDGRLGSVRGSTSGCSGQLGTDDVRRSVNK